MCVCWGRWGWGGDGIGNGEDLMMTITAIAIDSCNHC